MKRILILGSSGMLGHQVYNYLKNNSNFTLINFANKNKFQGDTILVDVRDEISLISCIDKIQPNYIINCVGALIRESNSNPKNAIYLNAYLPLMLAEYAHNTKTKLIHISTDCVFSGIKKKPYKENDEKDGKGFYALSKGLGEPNTKDNLIIRTSIVGPELKKHGEGLFNWFMNQSGIINGYTKSIWSGVTTIELAKAIQWSIENEITGIYHITNNEAISKYDLLNLFKQYTKKKIEIKSIDGVDSDKSLIDTRKLMNYDIPSYQQMISDMISFIHSNPKIYPHYNLSTLSEK